MFRIADAPGKGVGVFATRNIAAGTMVLSKKPIVVASSRSGNPNRDIVQQLQDETADDKLAFFALANEFADDEIESALGIFRTNAMPLGAGSLTGGVFLQCSRFDHACTSNAAYSWNEDVEAERIISLREITEDEEITVCYISEEQWRLPRAQRKGLILKEHKFICECSRCTSGINLRKKSDKRGSNSAKLPSILLVACSCETGPARRWLCIISLSNCCKMKGKAPVDWRASMTMPS
jgi:hypothetical protein